MTQSTSANQTAAPSTPLQGIRVIDLTSVIMGPFATRILADMGADVIKIEPPEGDVVRQQVGNGVSYLMMNLFRNKRSVVLDLKSDQGKDALRKLLQTADVFVHNLRPPVMERLGFKYEAVKAISPDIIYCSAFGFGSDGPYAHKPAYDDIIQAVSGFAAASVEQTGEATYAPAVISDKLVGMAIAYAVMGGLLHRERGGGGQEIEVPMFETMVDFNLIEGFGAAVFEPARGPSGYPRALSPERKPFRTADGFACIMPYSKRNWFDFFDFVGTPELKDAYSDPVKRVADIDALYGMIRKAAPNHTTAEWVAFCENKDVPCMPVLTVSDLVADPHVNAVGLMQVMEHPHEGSYHAVRSPVLFRAAPFELRRHAPVLGEHTEEVLREIGLLEDD